VPSDREFLRQRLDIVEQQLTDDNQDFIYEGKGRGRRRIGPASRRNITRHREARLLRKLLRRTHEGQVLATLESWRRELGDFLRDHRTRYRAMQEAYDAWWQLPPYEREEVPQPPKPPPPRLVDRDGAPWIIDDRFLALLDDLIARLKKWLEEP